MYSRSAAGSQLAVKDAEKRFDTSSLRLCVSAGEALPDELFTRWRERFGVEIIDGIGTTEIGYIFISNRPGRARPGSSGVPVPGYELAIVDAMQYIRCNVQTVCVGQCSSMGAVLLAAGTKGKRQILPNSRVMIHQPHGGAGGTSRDIEIQAKEIMKLRGQLNEIHASLPNNQIFVAADFFHFLLISS